MARILVLDPNDATRALARRILVMDHHVVTDVQTGADLLAALNSSTFDAIVVDMDLPDTDAMDLVEMIRLHHAAKTTPMIVATTETRDDHHRLMRAGVSAVVDKPMRFSELQSAIADCVAAGPAAVEELIQRGRSATDLYLGAIDLTDQARSETLGPSQPS